MAVIEEQLLPSSPSPAPPASVEEKDMERLKKESESKILALRDEIVEAIDKKMFYFQSNILIKKEQYGEAGLTACLSTQEMDQMQRIERLSVKVAFGSEGKLLRL